MCGDVTVQHVIFDDKVIALDGDISYTAHKVAVCSHFGESGRSSVTSNKQRVVGVSGAYSGYSYTRLGENLVHGKCHHILCFHS